MHDVGKIQTPTSILHKADKLDDEEYEIVKRHPVDGATMVASLGDDELTAIVRHHHERLDGTGYPSGLAGDEIPLGARILAVADTFDAITSTRPYRPANPHKKALDILSAEAGTQLDPAAVKAFLECYSGRKPLAFWSVLVNSRPRVENVIGQSFSQTGASNALATVATAAAVGAVAVGSGANALPTQPRTVEVANVTAGDRSSGAGSLTKASRAGERGGEDRDRGTKSARSSKTSSGDKTTERRDRNRNGSFGPSGREGGATRDVSSQGGRTGAGQAVGGQGGGGQVSAPNGNAYAYGKAKGPGQGMGSQGKGKAYGYGNSQGQGQGNAYGHGQVNGTGGGQGNGTAQGNGNAQGHGGGRSRPAPPGSN